VGFETEEGRGKHYRISPRHPNCHRCGLGFKDKDILSQHTAQDHPEESLNKEDEEDYFDDASV